MATAETAVLPPETMQTAHRNRQIPHGERMHGIPSMGTCDEPKGMVSNGIIPTGAQDYGRGVVQKAGTYPNSNTEMTETAGCHKRHAPWCERGRNPPTRLYAGHDTSSGVKVSNEPVRRNQTVEDKFAPAREWMKEVQDETRRTRTGNGYKAYLRASRQYTTKPQT